MNAKRAAAPPRRAATPPKRTVSPPESAGALPESAATAPQIGAAPPETGGFAVLQNRPFLLLWLAQLASQVGGNMVMLGLLVIIASTYPGSKIAISILLLRFLRRRSSSRPSPASSWTG